MSYKFINMKNRPLEFDVKCGNKVVIPAGSTNVRIAFRQSHMWRTDDITGEKCKMNVYLWKSRLYHA